MKRRKGQIISLCVAVVLLAAVLGFAGAKLSGIFKTGPKNPAISAAQWAAGAESNTLVTDPTADLTTGQIAFLRQTAARTWSFLSGPDLNPTTHLPLDSLPLAGQPGSTVTLAPPTSAQEYTNPALIGTYLSAITAAKDLGVATPAQAEADAAATVGEIQQLAKYGGFLFRWYSTETGAALKSPKGAPITDGYVSTVDNGWLAQGLLVTEGSFPQLSTECSALLNAMQWQLLYDKSSNVLYNGYQVGGKYSNSTYDNAYSGPRIAYYMAIGSGKVPGSLWWGVNRTPPASKQQRQDPQGEETTYTDPQNHEDYSLYEGHYVYDAIKFVPTLNGSLYQALAPNLMFPEETLAPTSLGLNDRNTALAQGAYGTATDSPVWGWAPATAPGAKMRYTNYGAPALASEQANVADSVVTPYAAFLALPVIPSQAYIDISQIEADYPSIYTQYGFLDSVNITNGQVAARYMTVSQLTILMSIDDAVNNYQLQKYVTDSTYVKTLTPYFSMEQYSIQGVDLVAGQQPGAQPSPTRTRRVRRNNN